jgi:hypothetical protein
MPASVGMVPGVYDAYLAAMATAAAALIGLLFVAVSVRDDTIFGPNAMPGGEALAITAFTGLVNSFVVSLLGLIPKINIGFGLPVRGRERQAVKVFGEALEYYARLQQQGEIESFETVLLDPHGGDLGGFTLVRGDPDKLAGIRTSEEFLRLNIRADLITEGFGVIGAVLGEQVGTLMGVYTEQVEDLT